MADVILENKGGVTPAPVANPDGGAPAAPATPAPSQDPVKAKLDEINAKKPKTEAEKAAFVLKSTAERLKSLGGDPAAVLGIQTPNPSDLDDDAPVTVGMLKQRDRDSAAKSSELLAEEQIEDANELELTKYHLANTIKSSGNPSEDLKNARALVNSEKNKQLATEAARKGKPRTHSSGAGAPPTPPADIFEPTAAEASLMRPPFNLSKDKILEARKKEEAKQA